MMTKLHQLQATISKLEQLAEEILRLTEGLVEGREVQPELSIKGQKWYRGARELLVQHNFSGLEEFDDCYEHYYERRGRLESQRARWYDIEQFIKISPTHKPTWWDTSQTDKQNHYGEFLALFQKARSLVLSLVDEISSRELQIITQLSLAITSDEFHAAREIFDNAKNQEAFLRAAGMVSRVALERHLHTVIDSHGLSIIVNPPSKKKATADDLLVTLEKNQIITAIQKSELESLFKIGNNCAHPKEIIKDADIDRLINRASELSSVIM